MDNITILMILAVLPVLIILLYVYKNDKQKEPTKLLSQLFLLGILSCFVTLYLTNIVRTLFPFLQNQDNLFDVFLYSFFQIALIEEFSKWIMVYNKGYHNKAFDESYDIIVYSIFTSLGFAFFENIIYVMGKQTLKTAITRAISSVPAHAFLGLFMGYFLSIAKEASINNNKKEEKKNIIYSLLVPTIIHGSYDFCIISQKQSFIMTFFIFLISLYIISLKKLHKEIKNNHNIRKTKFCTNCGYLLKSDVCEKCHTINK